MADEIDDFVDEWHDGKSKLSLEEYLGFSEEEFHLWVENPKLLGLIIAVHFRDPGFIEAVNDNSFDFDFQLAARANSTVDIKALKAWLKSRNDI